MTTLQASTRYGTTTLARAYNDLRADYNAATQNRFRRRLTGVSTMGSGGDYHYRSESDFLRMIEWARAFDRNDPVVGQGVTRLIRNVLQQGMKLDVDTGDDSIDKELKSKWDRWRTTPELCDRTGELTFHAMAELVLRHVIIDGDHFALPNKNGSLQLIEGHRVRRPRSTTRNVVHGILLDDNRRRMEYWVARENIEPHQQVPRVSDVTRYRARGPDGERQVFQVYNPKRVSQTRGVTAMAPIVDIIGMHDDIQFAKLVQAQISSCFAVFRKVPAGSGGGGDLGDTEKQGAQTTDTLADGSVRTIEGIAPGMQITGRPGEELEGFSPNVPNPEFFSHAMLILTFIAINLDIPLAVLLLDPSKTNFSGWRGAMDQARIGFRSIQDWIVNMLYDPVYAWQVRRWLIEDESLRARGGYMFDGTRLIRGSDDGSINIFGHRWSPPSWPYIEPAKDAKADSLIIAHGLNSRRGVLNRRGLDLDVIDRESVTDARSLITMAIEAADEINADSPDAGVSWQEVLSYAASTASSGQAEPEQPENAGNANDQT